MSVIGFSFTKMLVEKTNPVKGKVNISNNVGIKTVDETKLEINTNKTALKFGFEFTSTYEPNIGNIFLEGEVIFLADKAKAEEALKNWKKSKKVDKEMMTQVLNNVLVKCNVKALMLSDFMNLPPPMPLPKVGSKEE